MGQPRALCQARPTAISKDRTQDGRDAERERPDVDRGTIRQACGGRLVGRENVVEVDLCHGFLVSPIESGPAEPKREPVG